MSLVGMFQKNRITLFFSLSLSIIISLFFVLLIAVNHDLRESSKPAANQKETDLLAKSEPVVLKNRFSSGDSQQISRKPQNANIIASDTLLVEKNNKNMLIEPPFYRVEPSSVANLSSDQQLVYQGIYQDYLSFYKEWSQKYPLDIEGWNKKNKEYEEQIILQLGSEAGNSMIYR